MNKPINITIEETKQSLIDVVNNSKLPPSVVELILKDICWDVNQLKVRTIMKEQKMIKEQEESTEE